MPEGAHPYPKWQGELRTWPAFPIIAAQELRRTRYNVWAQYALILIAAYTVLYLGNLYQLSRSRGDVVHTMDNFLVFFNLLPWGALALASIMSGPALLEDSRFGALELYLSRAVTTWDYLTGKILAVVGLAWLAVSGPALLYVGMSYVFFDAMPADWHLVPLKAIVYGLAWALLAGGLGLGLSCVARSSRAATLLLFGGIVIVDVFIANLLEGITRDSRLQILSPLSALQQQQEWLFGVPAPYDFPYWWGLLAAGALTLLGWALVVWRHPRLKGVE